MWAVTYWDDDLDRQVTVYKPTHEEALRKQVLLKAKGHRNVQIKLKGAK